MAEHHDILWAIMKDPRASAASKCAAVALLLKFRNHATGVCNPSFDAIAKAIGRSRRPTIEALRELKNLGWLSWTGTGGGSSVNTNRFTFDRMQRVLRTAPVLSATPVLSAAQTGAENSTGGVLYPAHEPSNKPSKNHESERARAISDDFRLDESTLAWALDRLGSSAAVAQSMFRFVNYHRQVTGKKAMSRDWQARARLWIEEDARKNVPDRSVVAAMDRLNDKLAAFDQGANTDVEWDSVLSTFVKFGRWTIHVNQFGAAPGERGCIVPDRLLVKHGLRKETAA